MIPIRALVSDVGQRVVTLNKREQQAHLAAWIRRLHLRPGASVLDFGCGTGLFAKTLQRLGLEYRGYDPDAAAVRYAVRLYPELAFTSRLEVVQAGAPYDLILANCCFHHIDDAALRSMTLPAIARLMSPTSLFLLCDVLPLDETASACRRLYNFLERGAAKRTASELDRLTAEHFVVRSRRVHRSFAFSAPVRMNPLYNDLILYELALAR